MNPQNRARLAARVAEAAWTALAVHGYVRPIDVLVGLGWLDTGRVERWRRGEIPYLERVVEANLPRISEAMKAFRSWANDRGLSASETCYLGRAPRGRALRFSRSGRPEIEKLYRTHWVAPQLSEKKRERLQCATAAPGASSASGRLETDKSA
ncbi:MAG: hypothetical protein JO288_16070 [Hyphomicrobiales bacterium]|nr:hypothetical protein [Hyphomicrobiales bacterium]